MHIKCCVIAAHHNAMEQKDGTKNKLVTRTYFNIFMMQYYLFIIIEDIYYIKDSALMFRKDYY